MTEIDMRLQMRGDRVERLFDLLRIGYIRRRRAQPREKRTPLRVVGEEAMHITAGDPAIGRDRAVISSIGKPHKRPAAIGS